MLLAVVSFFGAADVPNVSADAHVNELATRTYINMRLGALAAPAAASTQICLEVDATADFGVDACGNASIFSPGKAAPELALFRGKLRGPSYESADGNVESWLGIGFAELQVGADAPGFYFLDTGPYGVETSGPVVTGSARGLLPLGMGTELVAEISLGVAYLPHAVELPIPQSPFQSLVSFSVGAGF